MSHSLNFKLTKSTPLILQSEASECGLACLAMISSFHGFNTSLVELRERFKLSLSGTTIVDLMKIGEQLNFSCRPLKLELEDIDQLKPPCILHWDFSHFVVLTRVTKRQVIILDPAKGEVRIPFDEASRHFTGIALELSTRPNFEVKSQVKTLKVSDLWQNIKGLRSSLLFILGLSLLLQLFILISPYYMQIVVDDVLVSADTSLLSLLFIGFLIVLIFESFTNALRGISLVILNSTLSQALSRNLFGHLVRLPISFFKNRHMGDIVSRFNSLNYIRDFLTTGVIEAAIDGVMALLIVAMLFFYSPLLAIIAISSIFTYILVRLIIFKPVKAAMDKEILARAEENSNFMETIKGIQTLKLFNSEVQREASWDSSNTNAINQGIKLGYLRNANNILSRLIFGIENLVIIYLAAKLVLSGGFSVGMMFAFITYKAQLTSRSKRFVDKYIDYKILGIHLERISDIALSKVEKETSWKKKQSIKGLIELRNVSYRYSDLGKMVVSDISFKIFPGESVAIIGPSGGGKSTLLKLMLGLITPTRGDVYIDGANQKDLNIPNFRSQISAVMQDDELFSGTIAENIAFFDPQIDMKLVISSAKSACIHETIERMPMGYQTLISNMGSSLSGGEKQRVVLARALYKEPKVLFLDEATSNLDNELEIKINSSIANMKITRVFVAHRSAQIKMADRVIDLDKIQVDKKELIV